MILLGVNIDHVATLRKARGGVEPSVLEAAAIAEANGADGITVHLREDRRHIQDQDVIDLRKQVKTRLNLEMAVSEEIVAVALSVKPDQATLVPEKREELTTEGGLDVVMHEERVRDAVTRLQELGIVVSLFIDPQDVQIDATVAVGAPMIELHTGEYANAAPGESQDREFERLRIATAYAQEKGLVVNAGHGLNYENTARICTIPGLHELNIGHSIISRAVFDGLGKAVSDMKSFLM